jgi:uncharacterized membrane protein
MNWRMNNKFFKIIFLLLGVAYPFVSYFLVDHPLGAYITIGFIVLLLLRSVFVNKYFFFVMLFAAIVLILAIIFCDKKIAIMLYPVVISISMAMIFVISIYYPPTLIEKLLA